MPFLEMVESKLGNETNYNNEKFGQELKIFQEFVVKNDFRSANIIGNRIMSNSQIFDQKFFGIVGLILKINAEHGIRLKTINDVDAQEILKDKLTDFIDNNIIPNLSSNKLNFEDLWTIYNNLLIKTRKAFLPKYEYEIYKIDYEISVKAFDFILKNLNLNKNLLKYPSNYLMKGSLNELNRISKAYGTDRKYLQIHLVLNMIERIDEYVGMTSISTSDFNERITVEIIPKVEKLLELKNNNVNLDKITDFLWVLIKDWRLYFINYFDTPRFSQKSQGQEKEIKPQVKSKLVEELAKGLEEEVGGT